VGSPARLGRGAVLGCGDGKVYAFGPEGGILWAFRAGAPLYGPPLVAGRRVYIGDSAGVLHALDGKTGKEAWAFRRAGFTIESRPAAWRDLLLFGAWDGNLYALDRKTGRLRWKVSGPRASKGAARYYAPADCGPVAGGAWCYLCDRGYLLGRYDAKGKPDSWRRKGVSALGSSPEGEFLNVRTLNQGLIRLDSRGREIWKASLPLGRIPVPPVEKGGRVYVVSDKGLAAALDAGTGKLMGLYQATPGLYVMASPGARKDGVCLVAGMDGSVTALRFPRK